MNWMHTKEEKINMWMTTFERYRTYIKKKE